MSPHFAAFVNTCRMVMCVLDVQPKVFLVKDVYRLALSFFEQWPGSCWHCPGFRHGYVSLLGAYDGSWSFWAGKERLGVDWPPPKRC